MSRIKIISWNIARRDQAWYHLLDSDADIALLQEASQPPDDVIFDKLTINPGPWLTEGEGNTRHWRTAIVNLSQRLKIDWIESYNISAAQPGDLIVSRPGTLTAATVSTSNQHTYTLFSLYAAWEQPHNSAQGNWIYADASAHRLISDLSSFIGTQNNHSIIAAGDLNILHGYGEHGSEYWSKRYKTVFNRLTAIGLPFVGPQTPFGRAANPWPDELPPNSKNVPTFHTARQNPDSATRQLDFVFASKRLANSLEVKALNNPTMWGPSDHCQVEINISDSLL